MKRRAFLAGAGAIAASCIAPGEGLPSSTTHHLLSPSRTADRIDALIAPLSLEQRVGQLMSVAFHGTKITPAVETMIRRRAAGGVVLRTENAADASALAALAADLQRIAHDAGVPPLLHPDELYLHVAEPGEPRWPALYRATVERAEQRERARG